MKKINFLIITIFVLSSCVDKNELNNTLETNTFTTNDVKETILYTGTSNYSKIFQVEAPLIGYSSLKENSLAVEELNTINQSTKYDSDGVQRISSINEINVSVNGLNLSDLSTFGDGRQRMKSAKSLLYGSNVTFRVTKNNSTSNMSKVISQDTTVTMYIPNIVNITSPKIEKEEELFPFCYYKDFEISWNADSENMNGLVVMLEWHGITLKGEKKSVFVRNIDIIESDNGSAKLNDKLFDNIPNNAIAYITLLRGNVTILENFISDESFRLAAESHAILPFVLVRNL